MTTSHDAPGRTPGSAERAAEQRDDVHAAGNVGEALRRLDALVRALLADPDRDLRRRVQALLQAVDQVHRAGLTRLLAKIETRDPLVTAQLTDDPAVHALLALYDLAPLPEADRAAGDSSLPDIASDRTASDDGDAESTRSGGPLSDSTPADGRRSEGADAGDPRHGLIPLSALLERGRPPRRHVVASADQVPAGTAQSFRVEDRWVLVANVAGTLHALPNRCPGSMAPLDLGTLDGHVLTCPWHGDRFDVRTGARLGGPDGPDLAPLPCRVVDGHIEIALIGQDDAA